MNPYNIIDTYYKEGALRDTLLAHSECVARKALKIAEEKKLDINRDFVYSAAMLHDIGIFRTKAPSIYCNGDLPYICHGTEGAKILRTYNLHEHARVCERHTGSGLTANDIVRQNLPLPHSDFLPETLAEKLICYADKFYSKSGDLTAEKTFDEVTEQMERLGSDVLERFMQMHSLFS